MKRDKHPSHWHPSVHFICFLLQALESYLQNNVVLNHADTGREVGPFVFSEEQEGALTFINSSDGSIDENTHSHYHIELITDNDSGTQRFSKWIMEVSFVFM